MINDQKSVNVKRGLRAKCEMGLWPAPAPIGYLNEKRTDRKGYIMVDPERSPVVKEMFEHVGRDGWSGRKMYKWLREIGFKSQYGKPLWLSNVYKILNTPLYYGEFEYPVKSGNWYVGKHARHCQICVLRLYPIKRPALQERVYQRGRVGDTTAELDRYDEHR